MELNHVQVCDYRLNKIEKWYITEKCKIEKENSLISYTSSHQRCSINRAVLKNFTILTGKHMCWSLFLIKVQASGHIYNDIGISRPKSHNIEIPRPKNCDVEIWGLKHHNIEKRRQLSHDIVIPRHFFRRQKATTSRFQD